MEKKDLMYHPVRLKVGLSSPSRGFSALDK